MAVPGSSIFSTLAGGAAGSHPPETGRTVLVGPTTSDKFNALRVAIFPIACWRVDDIRFEFDSSFVLPDIAGEMALLAKTIDKHTVRGVKPPLSIFGHADPVGDDNYNKVLSGRRAAAIYGLVTRRTEVWEDIFTQTGKFTVADSSDSWGLKSIQTMLATLGHDPGEIDGKMGSNTRTALESFRDSPEGGGVDVSAPTSPTRGKAFREKLFKAYMNSICKDDKGGNFELAVTDFLGNGGDQTGKADFQGCSEFNPVLLFSQEEDKRFARDPDKTERNEENAPNRRVVAFLYRPGLRVNPKKWPCPRAKESVPACRARFWDDGDQRRSLRLPTDRRKQEDTHDTFACRFYDRMASRSPCEGFFAGLTHEWVLRILTTKPARFDDKGNRVPVPPEQREPLANADFVITGVGGTAPQISGTTDAFGVLRVPVSADPADMKLTVGKKDPKTGTVTGIGIILRGGSLRAIDAGDEAIKQRLHNLGYGKADLGKWDDAVFAAALKQFRSEHDLPDSGPVDQPTRDKLKEVHGS